MNRKFLIAATVGLGLAFTGVALAAGSGQCPMGGPGGGQGMMQGHGGFGPMGGGFGPGRSCEDHGARQAAMLAYAEKKLNITDAQRGAWNDVVTAVKSGDAAHEAVCAKQKAADPAAKVTLPQRLDLMQEHLALKTQHLGKVAPAVKALYEKLTPEQKTTADEFFNHGRGGMGHGMGPGKGMGAGPGKAG